MTQISPAVRNQIERTIDRAFEDVAEELDEIARREGISDEDMLLALEFQGEIQAFYSGWLEEGS